MGFGDSGRFLEKAVRSGPGVAKVSRHGSILGTIWEPGGTFSVIFALPFTGQFSGLKLLRNLCVKWLTVAARRGAGWGGGSFGNPTLEWF